MTHGADRAYSNDLTQWLTYKPTDPQNNLAAFAHVYNFNSCSNTSCYDGQLAPVGAQVPLSLTEIGENDCGHSFIDTLMTWADGHGIGYLGWTWNTWDCSSGPSLISNYDGTATAFGQGLKSRLATVSNWRRFLFDASLSVTPRCWCRRLRWSRPLRWRRRLLQCRSWPAGHDRRLRAAAPT